jgi:hypothetical protein
MAQWDGRKNVHSRCLSSGAFVTANDYDSLPSLLWSIRRVPDPLWGIELPANPNPFLKLLQQLIEVELGARGES